jgi:hypothetical protein
VKIDQVTLLVTKSIQQHNTFFIRYSKDETHPLSNTFRVRNREAGPLPVTVTHSTTETLAEEESLVVAYKVPAAQQSIQ